MRMGVLIAVALIGLAMLVPMTEAKVWRASDNLSFVDWKIDDVWGNPLPLNHTFHAGDEFGVYYSIHNNNSNPYKGYAVEKAYWKTDWESEWKEDTDAESGGEKVVVIWGRETKNINVVEVKIPKNITAGEHRVEFKLTFYLYGGGWDANQGSDTTPLYGNFTFTVGEKGSSTEASGGSGMLMTAGIVAIVVVAVLVAVVLVRRRKS